MTGYVVTVEFRVKADSVSDFLRLVTDNARFSVVTEPGCHQFDVVLPEAVPDAVFLYEIYTDKSAFESHCATQHFLDFDRLSAPMVRSKAVTLGALYHAGSKNPKTASSNHE